MSGNGFKEQNINKFIAWRESVRDNREELIAMEHRGQLSRTAVAKAAGFGKSALKQNAEVLRLLLEFEEQLREQNILPKKVQESESKKKDIEVKPRDRNEAKVVQLEIQVNKLTQENLELKAKLTRFEELHEILVDLGVI